MTSRARIWTFAVVSIALFMTMLDNLVVLTALPAIREALHASLPDLEWTVNAYTLTFAVLMMTGAALGDRFGRKRMFLVGVGIFTGGSALAALSSTSLELALSRGTQGLGAAFVMPLTLTILTRAFPEERRAAIIGLWSGISGLGLAIGPLIGGAIVSGITWSAIFWINVPVGILVIVLGLFRLEESYGERARLDFAGLVLAAGGLLGVTYGLIRGNALGWGSAEIIGPIGAGIVLLVCFLIWEMRASNPMLPLGMFKIREFSAANSVGFLMSAGMFGSIFLLTLFLQEIQGASPLQAGIKTMAWTGTILVVAPVAGILTDRLGSRYIVAAGMMAQTTALVWIGLASQVSTPYSQLLPAFILGGLGMGLTFAPLSATVMAAVRGNQQGVASGSYNAIRELGGVFGVAILGAVFQHVATTPQQFVQGFHVAVFAGAVVVGLGGITSIFLPSKRGSEAIETHQVKEPTKEEPRLARRYA